MNYYTTKTLKGIGFEEAIEKVKGGLKEQGFGVLTEIDVRDTLKKKIDVDFPSYRILGACNPPFAHKALLAENKIGVMLPCNVVVQDIGSGNIEVTAVDPVASMMAIQNPALESIAGEVRDRLNKVIESL